MALNVNTMGFNPGLGNLTGFNAQTGMQGMLPQVQNFNLRDDPGYQFRQDEGIRAAQQSAAARGMLGSGATLKGLARFGQDLASQEYGAAHQRHLQNLGAAEALQQGQFGREQATASVQEGLRQGHFGRQRDTATMQEGLRQGQFGRARDVEQLQEALRHQQFNRQLGLADLGMRGVTGMAGLVNPSIPAFSGPGMGQAQMSPQIWAQLMQGGATNLENIGQLMGNAQLGSGQAWGTALGDISRLMGQHEGAITDFFRGFGGGSGSQPVAGGTSPGSVGGGGLFNIGNFGFQGL